MFQTESLRWGQQPDLKGKNTKCQLLSLTSAGTYVPKDFWCCTSFSFSKLPMLPWIRAGDLANQKSGNNVLKHKVQGRDEITFKHHVNNFVYQCEYSHLAVGLDYFPEPWVKASAHLQGTTIMFS